MPRKSPEGRKSWSSSDHHYLRPPPSLSQQQLELPQLLATCQANNLPKAGKSRSYWYIRCLGRVALTAADGVRCKEPFHALDISGGYPCLEVHRCSDRRSILRPAPSRSGYPSHHRQLLCLWCDYRGHRHRKGKENHCRTDCLRCHG